MPLKKDKYLGEDWTLLCCLSIQRQELEKMLKVAIIEYIV